MSLSAAAIRLMAEKGLSALDIAEIADAIEIDFARAAPKADEQAERRRAADRERKRDARLRNVCGMSADTPEDAPFPAPSPSFPPDPQTNPTPTHTPGNTPRARKGSGISDDWEPVPFGPRTQSRAIVDGWPPGEAETQLEHFRAHHRAKGSVFKDWQEAWSTWVLNSQKFGARNGTSQQNRTTSEPRNPLVRAVARRKAERAAGEFSEFSGRAGSGPEGGGRAPAISGRWD